MTLPRFLLHIICFIHVAASGAVDGIRTRNTRLGRTVLYHWTTTANMVCPEGIEPSTPGLKVLCSTNWATGTSLLTLILWYIFNQKKSVFWNFFYKIQKTYISTTCLPIFQGVITLCDRIRLYILNTRTMRTITGHGISRVSFGFPDCFRQTSLFIPRQQLFSTVSLWCY